MQRFCESTRIDHQRARVYLGLWVGPDRNINGAFNVSTVVEENPDKLWNPGPGVHIGQLHQGNVVAWYDEPLALLENLAVVSVVVAGGAMGGLVDHRTFHDARLKLLVENLEGNSLEKTYQISLLFLTG